MKFRHRYFRLQFRHTFHIAAGARNTTDAVYVELEENGMKGYGEVALPPYLKTSVADVVSALSHFRIPDAYETGSFFSLLEEWSKQDCIPACAAMDMALHDLQGKLLGIPVRNIYNATGDVPPVAFTIGMSEATEMRRKIEEASDFTMFKLKLGGDQDRELVTLFRQLSDAPFCVDANRGWKEVEASAAFCSFLKEMGCLFVEQPFEKEELQKTGMLKNSIDLPLILDESVQVPADVGKVHDYCDGINIKSVKCGGLQPAFRMIQMARALGLKVFLGCMSEGSCGCGSLAQLAGLADYVDLDGPLLISNDPFYGLSYRSGKIVLPDVPGSGVFPQQDFLDSWE